MLTESLATEQRPTHLYGFTSYLCDSRVFLSVPLSSLSYERSQTVFRVGQPPFSPVMREIPLINQFDLPIVLYDVKLPSKAQEYFSVSFFLCWLCCNLSLCVDVHVCT